MGHHYLCSSISFAQDCFLIHATSRLEGKRLDWPGGFCPYCSGDYLWWNLAGQKDKDSQTRGCGSCQPKHACECSRQLDLCHKDNISAAVSGENLRAMQYAN